MCVDTTVYVCDCVEIVRSAACHSADQPSSRRVPCGEHTAAGTFGTQPHRQRRVRCRQRNLLVLCYCEHHCSIARVWLLFNYAEPPCRNAVVCPQCIGNFIDTPFCVQLAPDHPGTVPVAT